MKDGGLGKKGLPAAGSDCLLAGSAAALWSWHTDSLAPWGHVLLSGPTSAATVQGGEPTLHQPVRRARFCPPLAFRSCVAYFGSILGLACD